MPPTQGNYQNYQHWLEGQGSEILIIQQENLETREKCEIVRIMDSKQYCQDPIYYKPRKIKISDEILKLEHQKFLVDTGISGEAKQISIGI